MIREHDRPPSDTTFDEPLDDDVSLPSPGDLVVIPCIVAVTEADADRGLGIFTDADGEEVAVADRLTAFGPDERGRLGVRGKVIAVRAAGEGLRVRVSLALPGGLALEDGRTEVELALAAVERL